MPIRLWMPATMRSIRAMSPDRKPVRRHGAARVHGSTAVVLALLGLSGCATQPDVRPLATGRADVSAYELNGGDLHALRQAAQRLCPLGGEIMRESGHSLPPDAEAGRWRSTVNTLAAWIEPPRRAAQMVVLCREPGDRQRLQPQLPRPPAAASSSGTPAEVTAGLPVGPIHPEW
jgi:hypothetical protein